jgi:formylglycine-generating enzyme required for sulfatase activity
MQARTTFAGPPILRNFVLFSREQNLLSPPREGALALRESDSGRIFLSPLTYPKSDRYLVQARIGNGPWETVLDVPAAPRIRVGNLKPGTAYRFRVIGANAMGLGPAFPPEGVAYDAPVPNRPPRVPYDLLPDSAATVAGTSPVLSWKGGDPDPGGRVAYTVYLDRRFPPQSVGASGLADSALALAGLEPGATYFWKVAATDGKDTVEGPVRSFAVAPRDPGPRAADPSPAGYPMLPLPRGTYLREDGREVAVGPFRMGVYEVTQAEFERVMGRNPSYRLQDSLPVERVTWEEAAAFCSEIGGRLPTEAEWEYAARAGSTGRFYWGSGDAGEYAWYRDNSDNRSRKVGGKKPNAWGLHDMAGNVFEWVQDWYGDYSAARLDHPRGPESGVAKVIRGASWYSEGGSLDLGSRFNNRPGFRNFKVGFRCARDIEAGTASGDDAVPQRSGGADPAPAGESPAPGAGPPHHRGDADGLGEEEPFEISDASPGGPDPSDAILIR